MKSIAVNGFVFGMMVAAVSSSNDFAQTSDSAEKIFGGKRNEMKEKREENKSETKNKTPGQLALLR